MVYIKGTKHILVTWTELFLILFYFSNKERFSAYETMSSKELKINATALK